MVLIPLYFNVHLIIVREVTCLVGDPSAKVGKENGVCVTEKPGRVVTSYTSFVQSYLRVMLSERNDTYRSAIQRDSMKATGPTTIRTPRRTTKASSQPKVFRSPLML